MNRGWKIYFIFFFIANLATIVVPWILFAYVSVVLAGVTGTEYIGFALAPFIVAGFITAAINIVSITLFLVKKRPKKKAVIIGMLITLVSIGYLCWGGITYYKAYNKSYEFNKNITKDEAISLINLCKIKSIVTSGLTSGDRSFLNLKTDKDAQFPYDYHRYIDDEDLETLKNTAQEASVRCGKIDIFDYQKPKAATENIINRKDLELFNNR